MSDLRRLARCIEDVRQRTLVAADALADGNVSAAHSRLAGVAASLDDEAATLERDLEVLDQDVRLGQLLRAVTAAGLTGTSSGELARTVLVALQPIARAARGYVVTFVGEPPEASVVAEVTANGEPPTGARRLSRAVLNDLVSRRAPVILTDAGSSRFSRETSVVALSLRSVLAVPVFVGDRLWGAVYLESTSIADAFTEREQELTVTAAQLLAPFIAGPTMHGMARLPTIEAAVAQSGHALIGRSPAIERLRAALDRLAMSDVPVLVEGESGTGKELVARALHFSGRRAAGPFVAVNCAAIPEGLIESELFGHERGAFTGATARKAGRFEQADGGTLFLDEVSEIRFELQAKLLRVLQESSFTRVGGSQTVATEVRLVAASNQNMRELVRAGRLREDLYHRLCVVPLVVPPLRERPADIRLLAAHFLADANGRAGRAVALDSEVVATLERYSFPGNVRELRNLIERLVTLVDGDQATLADLPDWVISDRAVAIEKDPFRHWLREPPRTNLDLKAAKLAMAETYEQLVRRVESNFVTALLRQADGNVSEAARLSGMNRTLFHRKLRAIADDRHDA